MPKYLVLVTALCLSFCKSSFHHRGPIAPFMNKPGIMAGGSLEILLQPDEKVVWQGTGNMAISPINHLVIEGAYSNLIGEKSFEAGLGLYGKLLETNIEILGGYGRIDTVETSKNRKAQVHKPFMQMGLFQTSHNVVGGGFMRMNFLSFDNFADKYDSSALIDVGGLLRVGAKHIKVELALGFSIPTSKLVPYEPIFARIGAHIHF